MQGEVDDVLVIAGALGAADILVKADVLGAVDILVNADVLGDAGTCNLQTVQCAFLQMHGEGVRVFVFAGVIGTGDVLGAVSLCKLQNVWGKFLQMQGETAHVLVPAGMLRVADIDVNADVTNAADAPGSAALCDPQIMQARDMETEGKKSIIIYPYLPHTTIIKNLINISVLMEPDLQLGIYEAIIFNVIPI